MNGPKLFNKISVSTILIALLFSISFSASALTNVTVLPVSNGVTGTVAISNFRWVIEEDQTYDVVAGETCMGGAGANPKAYKECLSLNFHRSYMPVIAQGESTAALPTNWSSLNLDAAKRYYISILPALAEGKSMGGAQIAAGQADAVVKVTTNQLPTAQIRVFIFEDMNPTNNTHQPGEAGLEGFRIILEDAGGRYGASGQEINKDVYGNPLGTIYDANGNIAPGGMGSGKLETKPGSNGIVTIKNLAPAKYGIRAVPARNSKYVDYVQTSTIEGTPTIDAWVKADEPSYFAEFGPPGPHVLMGFVPKSSNTISTKTVVTAAGTITITGNITAIHNSRPPVFDFFSGGPISGCMVALNLRTNNVVGPNIFVSECDVNGNYTISNVPVGNYSLSIWDKPLDYIFGQVAVTVEVNAAGQIVPLPPINPSLFAWFARLEQNVFYDTNENGVWDTTEVGMPEVPTGIRWRDGTIYQGFPTDTTGSAPYDQVFPFFSWLVAEVDFSRYKSTGVTVEIDGGGQLPIDQATGEVESLNPQIQPGGGKTRTQTGEVLTQAFQGFLGQTSVINWGKIVYPGTENGGITGIVYYAVTRAEDDPEFAGAEVWEPGIPRIQVALYEDDGLGGIKDQNGNGIVDRSDVDNAPIGWSTGGAKGAEDFDYNANSVFDAGDAIQITTTDSWDDNVPTGCVGDVYTIDGYTTDCFDGLRNFNQVRPGVFDGGYAFASYFPGGMTSGSLEVAGLPIGSYIVGTGDHPAYETIKEEDKNVDFGIPFIQPNLLPPKCVGTRTTPVPAEFSLFPGTTSDYLTAANTAATPPPLCNEKQVKLSGGQNSAADFYLFTQVPVAGHIMGFILNDLANEFDPNAPTFGEKFSPPNIPVSIHDWQGNEIGRTYSDRWGSFNVLVPSTFTENLPTSSGISPNMLTACMNDPGPIKDTAGNMVIDPFYKKQYSQFCYTFNYMPGVTTYLDTPVLPIAAFTGIGQNALDCEYQTGTPVIWVATNTTAGIAGPLVTVANQELTIVSMGTRTVINPESATPGQPATISRDFGFGALQGRVTIDGRGDDVQITSWSDAGISVRIPRSGNLEIIRDDGRRTQSGIHVTVGGVFSQVVPGDTIQNAITNAQPGSTIIIPQGTYNEMVVMSKPVKLQGAGASTVINAANIPSTKLADWTTTVRGAIGVGGTADLLPMQETGGTPLEQILLFTEAGAGIIVLAKDAPINAGGFGLINLVDAAGEPIIGVDAEGNDVEIKEPNARIDGISITGSDNGGGIIVNGFARDLEISNNRVYGNYGIYSGGIRVGHPVLLNSTEDDYQNAFNTDLRIHHNYVSGNGSGNGFGGGISMNHGSDSYQITKNYVCGNFTSGNGGGIGHFGFSDNGLIKDNVVIFNQSFKQQNAVSGGGIFVGGAPAIAAVGQPPTALQPLSPGAGSITIDANLIQGNNAGAGSGAGINISSINGKEVTASATRASLNSLTVTNNIIVNNVAGFAGGGIAMSDTVRVNIINNTITHNDSSATSGDAFCGATPIPGVACVESTPQPAGVVSFGHSPSLARAIANSSLSAKDKLKLGSFSNPSFINNIVWENRSFFFRINQDPTLPPYELIYSGITDLAVVGAAGVIKPNSSLLTVVPDLVTDNGIVKSEGNNIGPNLDPATVPAFVNDYVNGGIGQTVKQIELTTLLGVQPAFDEGGNFIDLRFGPLSLTLPRITGTVDLGSNYHLTSASSAIGTGDSSVLGDIMSDIDNDARSEPIDIGADQYDLVNNVSPIIVNGVAVNGVAKSGASKSTSATSANTGGGCTIQSNSRFDPLFPLLMILTFGYLIRRSLILKRKSATVVANKVEV
ncbi:MAG: JDVT-CTERM domain-containing protein [Thiohalomonadales bacterium]